MAVEPIKMYTVQEAAEILGVSERTIYRALRSGHMSCHRLGVRTLRFTDEDVRSFVTAEPAKPRIPEPAKTRRPVITRI